MIDISNWKEFRVGDYFHGIRGTSRKLQVLNNGDTPVIAAARYRQGIAGYYDIPSEYENAITISCNGVGCGSTYYHDYPFAITGDAIVLENRGNVPQGALHFLAAVFDAHFSRIYSYGNKCSADKAEEETVKLPARVDGRPDWDYMESYMKAVMEESEKSLENLKKADETKHLIDVSKWGEFAISDLFKLSLPKGDLQVKKVEEGNVLLITPSNFNNGLLKRISADSKSTLYDANSITVDMFGNAYYQDEAFFVTAHGHVNVLIPNMQLNIYTGTFIASTIRAMFLDKYGFSEMCTLKVLKSEKIKLPINQADEPDWLYMEKYMKKMLKKSKDSINKINTCI